MAITITRDLREINDELKNTDSQLKSAAREAKSLSNAMKLDPSSVKLSSDHYRTLNTQLDLCSRKVELLREKQSAMVSVNGPDAKLTPQYQKLETEIAKTEATATSLETQLKKTNKVDFSQLKSGLQSIAKTAAAITAAVVGIGVAFASSADEIQKAVDKWGITAEDWQYQVNQWDKVTGEAEAYASTLSSVLSVQGQISKESSRVGTVLEQLGLTFEDFTGKSTAESLQIFIDALKEIADAEERQAIAASLFGSSVGTYVAQMCEASAESLQEYNDALTEAGVLTSEQVAAGADLQDTFDYLKQSLMALVAEFGDALKPTIETLVSLLKSLLPFLEWVAEALNAIGPAGVIALGTFASLIAIIPKVVMMMAALHASMGNIAGAVLGLTALAAAGGAVAGMITALTGGASAGDNASTYERTYAGIEESTSALASGTGSSSSSSYYEGDSVNNYTDNSVINVTVTSDVDADQFIAKLSALQRTQNRRAGR